MRVHVRSPCLTISSSSRLRAHKSRSRCKMSSAQPISYCSAFRQANHRQDSETKHEPPTKSDVRRGKQRNHNLGKLPIRYLTVAEKDENATAYKRDRYLSKGNHIDTGQEERNVYVLTLYTTRDIHKVATDLRERYYPPRLNKTSAHLTLFYALPGVGLQSIRDDLEEVVKGEEPFELSIAGAERFPGGVALNVEGTDRAKAIYSRLREKWSSMPSWQDRGPFRAQYTIQNEVEDEKEADRTMEEVNNKLNGSPVVTGEALGLTLFRYHKGSWHFRDVFRFKASDSS